jgi:excisionase family DNA binding protein
MCQYASQITKVQEVTLSDQILLGKREAARMLSLSVRTVDNLIAQKRLLVRRVGRRVLISRRALEEFARHDHPTHGGPEPPGDEISGSDNS